MQALRNVRKKAVKKEEPKEEEKKEEEKKEEGTEGEKKEGEGDQLTLKKTSSKDLAIIRKRKAGQRKKQGEERDIRLQGEWNDFEEIPGIKVEVKNHKD